VTPELGSPHPGNAAPDFELVDQNGKTQKLSSYKGRIVVLAFMAGFCPFSRAEQPYLKKLAEDYAGKDVQVLGVLVKEDEADYAAYMARMPMPPKAPVIRDGAPAISTSNLLIDPAGTIQYFTLLDVNHFDAKLAHLRTALDKLIGQKQGG
jgi:thiol-disulfide isomerase/thioredoxin